MEKQEQVKLAVVCSVALCIRPVHAGRAHTYQLSNKTNVDFELQISTVYLLLLTL